MDKINVTNLHKGEMVDLVINKVKQFRVVRDITQEQLASAVNITRQSLIAIEKNKYNPSLELALKLCEYFDCKVEDLFRLDKTGEEL
ncbi:transcriptional regulator [Bacillus cereus]|uniref:helix-turn-helix transcriptional regulator n=1 Tax=Bacillus nitratireducens TaxID=2026193 RepID=UPI000534A7FC|nr:helix-turn-helix transcriptional regulator [Bacillus nitratireducens]PEA21110.1 transcriptional regulator [Bacillus cereus]PEW01662.1 transcriptional regulator [Bacillus cereus]PEZ85336.1 transcriptional regulator [Bacillus cereus]PFA35373.1 transcriptional regulator [Bacillus cereus]PFC02330.1 transcriptional regulator [Bacillus cereus]